VYGRLGREVRRAVNPMFSDTIAGTDLCVGGGVGTKREDLRDGTEATGFTLTRLEGRSLIGRGGVATISSVKAWSSTSSLGTAVGSLAWSDSTELA
jgi:hypothetical protein